MNYMSREFLQDKDESYVSSRFSNEDPSWPEYSLELHDGVHTFTLYDYASGGREAGKFMNSLKTIRKHIDGLLEVMEANPIQEKKDEN